MPLALCLKEMENFDCNDTERPSQSEISSSMIDRFGDEIEKMMFLIAECVGKGIESVKCGDLSVNMYGIGTGYDTPCL